MLISRRLIISILVLAKEKRRTKENLQHYLFCFYILDTVQVLRRESEAYFSRNQMFFNMHASR